MKYKSDYNKRDREEENEEKPQVILPMVGGMALLRLKDCATTTRLGMIDQWPGPEMRKLEGMRLIEKIGNGYQATLDGFAYLITQRDFLKRI